MRLHAARPRSALQTAGGAAPAAAAAGRAGGLQQGSAPQHGGSQQLLWRVFTGSDGSPDEPLYLLVFQYLLLLKKLPAEDSLSPEDFDTLLRPLA